MTSRADPQGNVVLDSGPDLLYWDKAGGAQKAEGLELSYYNYSLFDGELLVWNQGEPLRRWTSPTAPPTILLARDATEVHTRLHHTDQWVTWAEGGVEHTLPIVPQSLSGDWACGHDARVNGAELWLVNLRTGEQRLLPGSADGHECSVSGSRVVYGQTTAKLEWDLVYCDLD